MIECKIIADSICRTRITTIECTYPRFIHSEVLTHRDRARNSASSRAIPWPKMCERIVNDPVVPIYWGEEKKGMQTGGEIPCPLEAARVWLEARDNAVKSAQALADLGVHKSLCNRLTEPFMWITVVMTATSWRNFLNQRCDSAAEIHIRVLAEAIKRQLLNSIPTHTCYHLPYIQEDEKSEDLNTILRVSTARCARVSYLQHGSKVKSIEEDLRLFDRLKNGNHWSPFEHPAVAYEIGSGPYKGWQSYRKSFPNECPVEGYPTA